MENYFIKLIAVFLVFCFCLYQNSTAQFNPNLAAKLQQTLDTQVAAFSNTKGVSASVYYPGQGVWKGASGLSFAGQPITTDMEFGLASNTKLFTAVAVMKLVEANILNLNDQLRKWLPKYANIDSLITIRQLLNHTSGIADVFTTASIAYIDANPSHMFTTAEVMAFVGPKLFNRGTSYSYSNTNYVLAGMIIESATGKSVAKIIRDTILTPQQLDSTFFDGKETVLGTIAHPWQDSIDGINISRNALNTLGTSAGAMYSTASEMVQWYQALLSGQVVNANSLKEITTFVAPGSYGFGIHTIQLFGRTLWSHGGTLTGYTSRMFYDPIIKASVCGLCNSRPSAIDGAVTGILLKTLIDYLPAPAGAISGQFTVCQGQKLVTYSTAEVTNATSYTWTMPDGTVRTSATNSITVDFPLSVSSGMITVVGTNMYGNGVESTASITVNPLPNVLFSSSIPRTICQATAPMFITGGFPLGGMYSGKGVVNSMFYPTIAGIGQWTVTYTYTNSNGCSASVSIDVHVVPLPKVTFEETQSKLCIQSGEKSLTGGKPSGGTYVGKGVTNGIFNPSIAGLGKHIITYIYADSNGCVSSDSTELTVVPLPKVTYTAPVNKFCINTPPLPLTGGVPRGGIYTGKGVINGIFDPSVTGVGAFTMRYSYTDLSGCPSVDSSVLSVYSTSSSSLNTKAIDSFTLNKKTYKQSGVYTQVLQNSNGCDSTITLTLTITTTGVDEDSQDNGVTIFPNPSHGTFVVDASNIGLGQKPNMLEIYNVMGMKVLSMILSTDRTEISTELQSGVYIYRVHSQNSTIFAGKLVVL